MTAQDTIRFFSYYLFVLGACVLLAPGLTTAVIFLPPPTDGDYVFIGILAIVLAYYYLRMAQERNLTFMQATVIGRTGAFLLTVLWVIFGGLAPNYLAIIAIDLAGAIWTAQALRNEGVPAIKLL